MIQLEKVQYTADDFLSPTDPHPKWDTHDSEYDDGLSAFLELRRNLFGVAYRMLRSAAEAEDIVQDVWLRWQTTDRSLVLDPAAFLRTITTRMCINLCKSARSRHETYVGTWFSEPVDPTTDPCLTAERRDALKTAVLVLLTKLHPTERAVYVLREAFDYSYCQIAEILQTKETNVRQLLTRARKHIAARQPAAVSSADRRRFLTTFTDAAQNGDLLKLEGLFTPSLIPDGRPCHGRSGASIQENHRPPGTPRIALQMITHVCSCPRYVSRDSIAGPIRGARNTVRELQRTKVEPGWKRRAAN